jgi:hypothetical protein
MRLVGTLQGVQANPELFNSNSNSHTGLLIQVPTRLSSGSWCMKQLTGM